MYNTSNVIYKGLHIHILSCNCHRKQVFSSFNRQYYCSMSQITLLGLWRIRNRTWIFGSHCSFLLYTRPHLKSKRFCSKAFLLLSFFLLQSFFFFFFKLVQKFTKDKITCSQSLASGIPDFWSHSVGSLYAQCNTGVFYTPYNCCPTAF